MLGERNAYIGEATNNVAEYRALLLGLELARDLGASEVEVINDSELVARQIGGEYKVKHAGLKPLFIEAMRDAARVRRLGGALGAARAQRARRRAGQRGAGRSAQRLRSCPGVRRLALLSLIATFALAPTAADAAIVPGATVDGPSADIIANSVVQTDAAPDGTAAIAYLKSVGDAAHVCVSRLVGGRVGAAGAGGRALATASSSPRHRGSPTAARSW